MQLSVVLHQLPLLPSSTTHLPWDDTVIHVCKTWGQLSSLFSAWSCLECLSPKCLFQTYKLQRRLKRELRAFLPFPAHLCLESTGEMSVQGKKPNNCNVTGYCYLLCFTVSSLISKALYAKLVLPGKVLQLCFNLWPFWALINIWNICLLRPFVPANQSHIYPLSLPRNSWTKMHTAGMCQKLTEQAFSTASRPE